MITVSGISRKYFIAAVVVILAVVGGLALFHKVPSAGVHAGDAVVKEQKNVASGAPAIPAPTLDEYKTSAVAAVKGFAVGDEASAATALSRLLALRVPREGMTLHQELVMALAAYDSALAAKNASAAAAKLARLKIVVQSNPWLGLSI